MLRKFVVGAALAGSVLAIGAPVASAAPAVTYAGTNPNFGAAQKACNTGIAHHRWHSCRYRTPAHTAPAT